MKKNLLGLFTIMTLSVFGSELNLTSGDEVIIEANTKTRVTCEGETGTNNCSLMLNTFEKLMTNCFESHFSSTYCLDLFWTEYKEKEVNPTCIYAGIAKCYDYCVMGHFSFHYCNDYCH